ncbi:hypothetical protein KCU65_g3503, partial [Aureobasidium melanogenum]
MGESTAQEYLDVALNYTDDLRQQMEAWTPQLRLGGTEDEEETAENCKNLAKKIFNTLEEAYVKVYNADLEADNYETMARYIADKAVADAVTRLATQMRAQSPQTPMIAVVLEMFFSNPGGNDERKDLEFRIKVKMGLRGLKNGDENTKFAEKVQAFGKLAGEWALKFAIEDAKKMVDENLRSLVRD